MEYDFDVAIYTEYSMSGYDARSSADNIFDYKGYGAGSDDSGILLYVSSEPRKYWFTTHGRGETVFNDRKLAYLESKVLPYLRENDYNSAFAAYAKYSEELLGMGYSEYPDDNWESVNSEKQYEGKRYGNEYTICVIIGALIVPLLIAYMMMKIKISQMNTAVKQNYASNYMKKDSMKLSRSQDLFLYSTVIKTAKPQPNSGSGSHTSSSGRSHGGRGGSY